jgi:uncharacterized protein (DUF58 family)
MSRLLRKVRARVSIVARRRVRTLVGGEYLSVFKSRGLDFEDLRLYVPGDSVKDIDWRATMRSGQPLVKQYVADRHHRIVFAVDTGRTMACLSSAGMAKTDVAVMAIGMIGFIAQSQGDTVSLVRGDAAGYRHTPHGRANAHLERILQQVDSFTSVRGPANDLPGLLAQVAAHVRHPSIVVLVTDDVGGLLDNEAALRRLRARHEMICVLVDDLLPTDPLVVQAQAHDVDTLVTRPRYAVTDRHVAAALQELVSSERAQLDLALDRLRIGHVTVRNEEDVVKGLLAMFDRMRRVQHR